jgi:hypothetical protein
MRHTERANGDVAEGDSASSPDDESSSPDFVDIEVAQSGKGEDDQSSNARCDEGRGARVQAGLGEKKRRAEVSKDQHRSKKGGPQPDELEQDEVDASATGGSADERGKRRRHYAPESC